MTRVLFGASLALVLLAPAGCSQAPPDVPDGTELVGHPDFERSLDTWLLRAAVETDDLAPDDEGPAWVLAGVTGEGHGSHVGLVLRPPITERRLRFTCAVQALGKDQAAQMHAFASDDQGRTLSRWSQPVDTTLGEWTRAAGDYVVPEAAASFTLLVVNQAERPLLVGDPSLVVGSAARADLQNLSGPGVIRARARTSVYSLDNESPGTVTFPIPLVTEHQVPLTFDLDVQPPEALRGLRWVPRDDGVNVLCVVDVLAPLPGATVAWESYVLVGAREDRRLPPADEPEVPAEAAPWTRSTACIQSDDEGIRAEAASLAESARDVLGYVRRVIAFTSTNQGTGKPFLTLDAAAALGCGGSCTSRANLAAALLRAEGIPARTAAHLPTWSGPLYEHWHVEYWHPGVGWTWVEPTLGALQPPPYSLVVINVAWPEDEDQGFDPAIGHSGVMVGVPRHSVHEHSPELGRAAPHDGERSFNAAFAVAQYEGDQTSLFEAARRAYATLRARAEDGRLLPERTAAVVAAADEAEDLLRVLEGESP